MHTKKLVSVALALLIIMLCFAGTQPASGADAGLGAQLLQKGAEQGDADAQEALKAMGR